MKTETADLKVKQCGAAKIPVLFDKVNNICLHNETKAQDAIEVEKFKSDLETYQNYLTDNGLDNDTNSISYEDLQEFLQSVK